MDEEWQEVKTNKSKNKTEKKILEFNELVKILNNEFKIFVKIVAGYIYGSRARKTNRIDSDVDIIIFMKAIPTDEYLQEFKCKLEKTLSLKVDLVICYLQNKWIEYTDLRDQCFFDNIIPEAQQFIGQKENIRDLIIKSIKMPKI